MAARRSRGRSLVIISVAITVLIHAVIILGVIKRYSPSLAGSPARPALVQGSPPAGAPLPIANSPVSPRESPCSIKLAPGEGGVETLQTLDGALPGYRSLGVEIQLEPDEGQRTTAVQVKGNAIGGGNDSYLRDIFLRVDADYLPIELSHRSQVETPNPTLTSDWKVKWDAEGINLLTPPRRTATRLPLQIPGEKTRTSPRVARDPISLFLALRSLALPDHERLETYMISGSNVARSGATLYRVEVAVSRDLGKSPATIELKWRADSLASAPLGSHLSGALLLCDDAYRTPIKLSIEIEGVPFEYPVEQVQTPRAPLRLRQRLKSIEPIRRLDPVDDLPIKPR